MGDAKQFYEIEVEGSEIIKTVKQKIQKSLSDPSGVQILISNGKVLNDKETLESYKIDEETIVFLRVGKPKPNTSVQDQTPKPKVKIRIKIIGKIIGEAVVNDLEIEVEESEKIISIKEKIQKDKNFDLSVNLLTLIFNQGVLY